MKITPGVSLELAQRRSEMLHDLRYDLSFDIPESATAPIAGQLVFTCSMREVAGGLVLDFKETPDKLLHLRVNGDAAAIDFREEHIVIDAAFLQKGENRVEIEFIAGDLSLNRNEDFLYTLLVPDRARTLFPVIDQPDLKAVYTLSLLTPPAWAAIANGAAVQVDSLAGKTRYQFAPTQPISTYLFAFAAGAFRRMTDPASGMTMYYRETDDKKVARNADKIFELHRNALRWLEDYTGIGYPFGKFDFALIPSFQYGGMEHPGAIWYRESSLMLDESVPLNQELRRASLIAHETAHMWFGNLVTMAWFSDVWLKEVFANLMAAKIVHPEFPEVSHELNFLLDHYPAAYAVDRTDGTHPIQQPLDNLQDAGTLYGAIIYEKAPIVMRNLETLTGEAAFQEGIRTYLQTYAYGNATWDDLIGILDKKTERDLRSWNRDWVKTGGMPVVSAAIVGEGDEKMARVRVDNSLRGQVWPQALRYLHAGKGGDSLEVRIEKPLTELPVGHVPVGGYFLPNPDGQGYGYFRIDQASRLAMLRAAVHSADSISRAAFWLNLYEDMLHGALPPADLLKALLEAVEKEKNPLILSHVLGDVQAIFWRFSPAGEREQHARTIEAAIIRRFLAEKEATIRRSLYQALLRLAYTTDGQRTLLRIWEGRWAAFYLPLSEGDYIDLACELALRNIPGSDTILTATLARTQNPDRRRRFEFLLPALSPEQAVRDVFFNQLKQAQNRAREPWVASALAYLHHPLRGDASLAYLAPSLDLIEEIQQTGDIFFPAAWLQNTLGSYASPEAAAIVRDFLQRRPDLSPNLRNKVLQASDGLFRAEEISR